MLHGSAVVGEGVGQLVALQVTQHLRADGVQRRAVQRVEADRHDEGEGRILHGHGVTAVQSTDGVGRALGGEGRVEGAVAQQFGLQGGGAVSGDGGIQHGVDAAQRVGRGGVEGGGNSDPPLYKERAYTAGYLLCHWQVHRLCHGGRRSSERENLCNPAEGRNEGSDTIRCIGRTV